MKTYASPALSGVTVVHVPDPAGHYSQSHPGDIEMLDPNRLVVAWRERIRDRVDMGGILYATSSDGGATWSKAREMLATGDFHDGVEHAYGNVILHAERERGVIYAIVGRSPMTDMDSEEQRLFALQSTDAGETWQPCDMTFPDSTFIIGGKIIKHNGRWLMPFHRNETRHDLPPPRFRPRRPQDKRDHGVLVSDDLRTWRLGGLLPSRPEDDVFLQEGYLVPAQDAPERDILCFTRTAKADNLILAHDPPIAFSARSSDGGETWSVAQPEPELYNTNAKAIVVRDSRGNYVTVYNVGPAWKRHELRYKTKAPGQPWSEERYFFTGEPYNCYVSMVETHSGEFACMWWASPDEPGGEDTRAVRFARFRPEVVSL